MVLIEEVYELMPMVLIGEVYELMKQDERNPRKNEMLVLSKQLD